MTKISDIVLACQNKGAVSTQRGNKIRNSILEYVGARNDEIFGVTELMDILGKNYTKGMVNYHTKILCGRNELGRIKIGGNVFFGSNNAIQETKIKLKELEAKEAEAKSEEVE